MSETKKLLSNSTIIFAGTIVGSFFSYLFNMLTGRILGPSLYGEFTALLSLMSILLVASGAVMTVAMKYASELYSRGQTSAVEKLFKTFSKYVLVFSVFLFVLCCVFIRPIEGYFALTNLMAVVLTFLGLIFGFLIVVNRGILQGAQKFLPLSITNALEMFLRLVIGILLIKLGLSLAGVMSGVVLATAIVYAITLFPVKKIFKKEPDTAPDFTFDKKEILSYTLPALIASIFLMVALNIDIILVKHYFDPETAGIYSAISTIAKIILYATSAIVGVMFPMISEKKATGEKHYKLLLFSILLTVIGSMIILGAYIIAPGTIIKILYGQKFVTYYSLLSKVGFFVMLYALINVMANYYLAIKNFFFLYLLGFIIFLQFILITIYHSSLEDVVKILIATSGLLFISLFGYYLITKKEQLSSYIRGEYGQGSES